MATVLDLVKYYQHAIEKYPNDEHKILKCIDKLYNLDVTVQHLQDTGVGRTVNALRKEPGNVGHAARALVNKWKVMVAAEDSDPDENHNNDTSGYNGHENGKDSDDNVKQHSRSKNDHQEPALSIKTEPKEVNGNYSGTKRKYHSSEDEEPDTKKTKSSSYSSHDDYKKKSVDQVKREHSESDDESEDSDHSRSDGSDSEVSDSSEEEKHTKHETKQEPTDRHRSSSSKHSSYKISEDSKKESSSSKKLHDSEKHSKKHHQSEATDKHSFDKDSTKEKSHNSHKHKSSKEKDKSEKSSKSDKHSSEKDKRQKEDSKSSSSKHKSDSDKHKSVKTDNNMEKHHTEKNSSKSEKHKSSSHSQKSEKEKHKSSSEKEISDEKHKSKHSSSSKDKQRSSSKERSKDKSGCSKTDSSTKDHHSHKSDKKHTSSSESKSKHSDSKSKADKHDERTSESKSKRKSSSSSSHKSKSSSSSKSKSEVPKKTNQANSSGVDSDDGIDCGSGASFAEALGMISPAKPKKKSAPVKESYMNDDLSPASMLAPTAKLAPLPAIEISALPEISPNYKPRPPPKLLPHFTDDDAMNMTISSKNQRTKVYSGNKVLGKIPTLYEMCVQVLQEHIDALEYTGGVPYDILKPVVDRATPQQMFVLEHYNPYLMEDTDHLWQKFCEKNFRNKQRQEMETWREMYMRCQEEQDHRLKSLAANIKIAQEAKKAPIKQTKMAYVDSVVKPPRNIARKQAQHGTAHAAAASPAARVASLAAAPGVLRTGVRPAPSTIGTPSSFKSKKAPLMQKALQFMRGRKR